MIRLKIISKFEFSVWKAKPNLVDHLDKNNLKFQSCEILKAFHVFFFLILEFTSYKVSVEHQNKEGHCFSMVCYFFKSCFKSCKPLKIYSKMQIIFWGAEKFLQASSCVEFLVVWFFWSFFFKIFEILDNFSIHYSFVQIIFVKIFLYSLRSKQFVY